VDTPSPSPTAGVPGTALAAGGLAASLLAGGGLVRLLIESRDAASGFLPYGGWQVDVVWAGLVVPVLVVGLVSALALRGRRHLLRARTPALLVAVLLGAGAGAGLAVPMRPALSWASDQTPVAKAVLRDYRGSAGTPPRGYAVPGPAAPAAQAVLLLSPGDLGAGWYPGAHPNPASWAVGPSDRALPGATWHVQAVLRKLHWDGRVWVDTGTVFSDAVGFGSPERAQAYARSGPFGGFSGSRVVDGVRLRVRAQDAAAVWVRGDTVFRVTLLRLRPALSDADFEPVLLAAVRRSTGALQAGTPLR
jgi:hypothetical protein